MAVGQTFFAASGDNSTWSRRVEAWPADDPNVVSVGGTDLITSGPAGLVVRAALVGQRWRHLSRRYRNPGVARRSPASSTPATRVRPPCVTAPMSRPTRTSPSTPAPTRPPASPTSTVAPASPPQLWAAYARSRQSTVDDQQQHTLIPRLPQPSHLRAERDDLHLQRGLPRDITAKASGSFSAVGGYDLVTGWGSPSNKPHHRTHRTHHPRPSPSPSRRPPRSQSCGATRGSSYISHLDLRHIQLAHQPHGIWRTLRRHCGLQPVVHHRRGLLLATFTVLPGTPTGTYPSQSREPAAASSRRPPSPSQSPLCGFAVSAAPSTITVASSSGTSTITTAVTKPGLRDHLVCLRTG